MAEYKSIRCARCGKLTQQRAGNQKYCLLCSEKETLEFKRQWRMKYKEQAKSKERKQDKPKSKKQVQKPNEIIKTAGTKKIKTAPYLCGKRMPKTNQEWIIYDTAQAREMGFTYGQYKAWQQMQAEKQQRDREDQQCNREDRRCDGYGIGGCAAVSAQVFPCDGAVHRRGMRDYGADFNSD